MGSLHLGLASFSCCARTPDLPLIVNFAFALRYFFPRYSVAEGGPLNLPQSMIIKLGLLNFLILFERQHRIIICSRPRPLQHTSPQYVGLTFHLTNTPQLQTRSSTLPKKLRSCAMPFVFSCQFPCHASFRPRPLGLKYTPTPLCACIFFFLCGPHCHLRGRSCSLQRRSKFRCRWYRGVNSCGHGMGIIYVDILYTLHQLKTRIHLN